MVPRYLGDLAEGIPRDTPLSHHETPLVASDLFPCAACGNLALRVGALPYFWGMRIPGRAILAACALTLAVGALAGCAPSHPDASPTKTSKPTPTPVFTSDAEALAAATAAYKRYLAVIDQIAQDGGQDPQRLRPYVSKDGLKYEDQEAKRLRDAGAHQTGATRVTSTQLQRRSATEVTIYACQDGSDVDVVDSTGLSLVDPNRANLVPYVATFAVSDDGSLTVESDKYWSDKSVCN